MYVECARQQSYILCTASTTTVQCTPPPHDTVTAPYLAGIAPFTAALQLDLGVFNVLLCAGPGLGRKWDQTDPKISPSFVTIQVNEFHSGGKRLLPMSDFITF